jgi:hypothetical protein
VRVQLAHHLADDAGRLDMTAVRAQPHLGHLEQDPSVHRLEAVAGIGQRPGVNDRVRVFQERALQFLGDVDVGDAPAAREVGGGVGRAAAAGHAASCSSAVNR